MALRLPSYEDAVASVRLMHRVRQFELGACVGADWRIARVYIARMEREGLLGPMEPDGWHEVLVAPEPSRERRSDAELQFDRRFDALRRLIVRAGPNELRGRVA